MPGVDRLSPLDASFLSVETPAAHMHVAWCGRFRPRDGQPQITLERVRRLVAARLHGTARFRQRVAFPPGGLAEPVWVDDEDFDLARHVLPLSGDEEVLSRASFAARVDLALSQPLARAHPLWRLHLAPRLEDGTTGVVMLVHHAMVDGKSAVALALLLLNVDPDAGDPVGGEAWAPAPAPGVTRLALDALAERGTEPLRAARGLARLASNGSGRARLTDTLRRAALAVGEDVLRPAPASYVNTRIGPRRRLVGTTMELERLLALKTAHAVTLNDIVLAVVAGALRQLALQRGVAPAPLKVMVPVSRRTAEQAADLGNRIAFVFIALPVHVSRPSARLDAIRRQTVAFKRDGRAEGGEALLDALGALPGLVQGRAARLVSSPRMYNLVISNVPGPRFPVYLLGAQLIEAYPVIPLSEGHALSVGCFTLPDAVCLSGYADPEALPVIGALPAALSQAVLELERRALPRRRESLQQKRAPLLERAAS